MLINRAFAGRFWEVSAPFWVSICPPGGKYLPPFWVSICPPFFTWVPGFVFSPWVYTRFSFPGKGLSVKNIKGGRLLPIMIKECVYMCMIICVYIYTVCLFLAAFGLFFSGLSCCRFSLIFCPAFQAVCMVRGFQKFKLYQ